MAAVEKKDNTIEMQIAQIPMKNVEYAEAWSTPNVNAIAVR
jgi:hypothetical protein